MKNQIKKANKFDESLQKLKPIYERLINFLDKGIKIYISNQEFMDCYTSIFQTCDSDN